MTGANPCRDSARDHQNKNVSAHPLHREGVKHEGAPSRTGRFRETLMEWIRPESITEEYDGFMRGRGTQVWDMLLAAVNGDSRKIRALLQEDARLANCNFAYMSPLHFAVREGHTTGV